MKKVILVVLVFVLAGCSIDFGFDTTSKSKKAFVDEVDYPDAVTEYPDVPTYPTDVTDYPDAPTYPTDDTSPIDDDEFPDPVTDPFYVKGLVNLDVNGNGNNRFPYGSDCDDDSDGFKPYECGGVDFDDSDPNVIYNGGDGTFVFGGNYDVSDYLGEYYFGNVSSAGYFGIVKSFDLDQDGNKDLIFSGLDRLNILFNNGQGGFLNGVTVNIEGNISDYIFTDANSDGIIDLVTVGTTWWDNIFYAPWGSLTIYYSYKGRLFDYMVAYDIAAQMVKADDLDNDGYNDLLVSNRNGREFYIFYGSSEGNFNIKTFIDVSEDYISYLSTGDVDLNGEKDIVASIKGNDLDSDHIILNQHDGLYYNYVTTPHVTDSAGSGYNMLCDFDNDDYLDIISIFTGGYNEVIYLLNNEKSIFLNYTSLYEHIIIVSISCSDLNGDGNMDIFVNAYRENVFYWGDGKGNFYESGKEIEGDYTYVYIDDINNDGKSDKIVFKYVSESLEIYYGQ